MLNCNLAYPLGSGVGVILPCHPHQACSQNTAASEVQHGVPISPCLQAQSARCEENFSAPHQNTDTKPEIRLAPVLSQQSIVLCTAGLAATFV